MARLLKQLQPVLSQYRDRRFHGSQAEFDERLRTSTTVYVGNLSFYTTEDQIYEVFGKCGDIKRIVMGLDKHKLTPCGFCFVAYYTRGDTEDCVKYVNGTAVDDRPIRVDFDWGFEEGRQYGRGRSGGQVRDEYRLDYDVGRGGYGKVFQAELTSRMGAQMEQYAEGQDANGVLGTADVPAPKRRRTGGSERGKDNPRFRERDSDEEDAGG